METSSAPLASALLQSARKAHAAGVTLRMQARRDSGAFTDLHAHNESLLEHLGEALFVQRPALFHHHVAWLARTFAGRGVSPDALVASLECLREEIAERLPPAAARAAAEYVDDARRAVAGGTVAPEPALDARTPLGALAARYLLAVLEGRRDEALDLVTAPVRAGSISAAEMLEGVLAPAQNEIGRLWQIDEANVGEEHLLSRTTEQAIERIGAIAPRAARNGRRVLVTSVAGDLHDLGLRMVALFLELDGWDVVFLGASTPAADVAAAARDLDVDVVALSAKLDLHVRPTIEVVRALRAAPHARGPDASPARRASAAAGLATNVHDRAPAVPRIPVIVGGAPFTIAPDLWKAVGADAHAQRASEVPALARRLCG